MFHGTKSKRSKINILVFKKVNTIKVVCALAACFLLFGNPALAIELTPEQRAQLDEITNQIKEIEAQEKLNRQSEQTISSEIESLSAQSEILRLQIAATQNEIDIANSQINELNTKIKQAQDEIARQKVILNEYLRTMYINGQVSQIELVLTSKSFSDFVDKSEYLDTMQQNIRSSISKIKDLTTQLENDKVDVEKTKAKAESLKESQVAQNSALIQQQSYKQSLLDGLDAANSQLEKDKNSLYSKKSRLSRQFGENIISGSTSYPYGNPTDSSVSCPYNCTPDAYGYYIGQCTSYVAWKRASIGKPIPPAIGNGGEWTGARAGYSQDSYPQYGDVMVFPYLGGYGHVAFVEDVNSDGTVYISEYNWVENSYTERTVNPYLYSAYFIH